MPSRHRLQPRPPFNVGGIHRLHKRVLDVREPRHQDWKEPIYGCFMKKTIIHVNQHIIKSNRKNEACEPVLTVKTGKSNTYAHEAEIVSESGEVLARVIYSPDKPLSCGAQVWIETNNKVILK